MEVDHPNQASDLGSALPAGIDNKPGDKMDRLQDGTKIQRRPMARRLGSNPKTSRAIYVSTKTPFMAVITRVRKQLDGDTLTGTTKGMPLASRVAALQLRTVAAAAATESPSSTAPGSKEVVIMGTGRAICKTLHVAAWFNRRAEYAISLRTRTVGVIDDVVVEDEDGDETVDHSRVRRVSCLEVGVRLR